MFVAIKNILTSYIRYNLVIFILVSLLFFIGTITGVFAVHRLPEEQLDKLSEYLDSFFVLVTDNQSMEYYNIFLSSISYNAILSGVVWLLGITMVGIPVLIALIFIRGLSFGFTIGFIIENLAFKGVSLTLVAILPHNLIFIPCFFMICVAAISFSLLLIKNQLKSKSIAIVPEFINYTLLFVIIGVGFVMGSMVEAYISPTFMKFLLEYF